MRTNGGIAKPSGAAYSCLMQQAITFDNAPAYDEDGHVVIKSTCRKCGAIKMVSVRDRSLSRWESQHTCLCSPKIPPKFAG